jgi:hypothetical protein
MKPPPNLQDDAAMLAIGKRSALRSARSDATESLRDALSAVNAADWHEMYGAATRARDAAERLLTLAAMWDEVTA